MKNCLSLEQNCTACTEKCRDSTVKELKQFGIASAEGGAKCHGYNLPDIIFATGEENKKGLAYRDLRKWWNSWRIKHCDPKKMAGQKVRFLKIIDD